MRELLRGKPYHLRGICFIKNLIFVLNSSGVILLGRNCPFVGDITKTMSAMLCTVVNVVYICMLDIKLKA